MAWYGRLTGERTPLQRQYPVDIAAQLKVPVLGRYGGQDQGVPPADIGQMRQALARAGNEASRIVVFPGAPHGFLADDRPSGRSNEATDAWTQCLAWFRQHGAG